MTTKPFWKTSEFWMHFVAQVIGLYQVAKPDSPDGALAGAILSGVSGAGYAISRGIAKQGK